MKVNNVFLNYACNARCPFCFNPVKPTQEEERGLPLADVAAELYCAYQGGARGVNFLGGEVTVRSDLPAIIAMSRKIGYTFVSMDTNAIRLADDGYLRTLVAAGLGSFRLSVHGHTDDLHDRQVRVPGAFRKVLAAIRNLQAMPVELGLNCVVNKQNAETLGEYVRFFADEMGVRSFAFGCLRHIGYMTLEDSLREMGLSMSDAAPHLAAACAELEKRGLLEGSSLSDLVPCVLPERVERMTDWSAEGNEDLVSHPGGGSEASASVCHEGKVKIAACKGCAFESRCLGVETAYLERYGETEFKTVRPVKGAAR